MLNLNLLPKNFYPNSMINILLNSILVFLILFWIMGSVIQILLKNKIQLLNQKIITLQNQHIKATHAEKNHREMTEIKGQQKNIIEFVELTSEFIKLIDWEQVKMNAGSFILVGHTRFLNHLNYFSKACKTLYQNCYVKKIKNDPLKGQYAFQMLVKA